MKLLPDRARRLTDRLSAVHFPALKGRQMIAQGKAAQQPEPWVTIPIFGFSRHSPPAEANDEKSKLSRFLKREQFRFFLTA
jgi:hypothetical protein